MSKDGSRHLSLLADSGWNTCQSVREGVDNAGLPVPTAEYLRRTFSNKQWKRLDRALAGLQDRFSDARFGDVAAFGALLVPDPDKLDTRGAVDPEIRRDQVGGPTADIVDDRLPAGKLVVAPGTDWTLVATIIGAAGVHFGSHDDVHDGPAKTYTVNGADTRITMTRQIWGARVLQSGDQLPDCEMDGGWTFTLLPGEGLVGKQAVSGTVLHGKVRFRLGRADRGIAVARVCPALVIE